MKWDYSIKLEVDTNDGDYINETCDLGTYDDADEQDQKSLAAEVLLYQHFEVDEGENDFDLDSYLEDLHEYGLKPSDRCDDWKRYDYIMDYLYGEGTKNPDKDMKEWKEEVEEEIGDELPWMDNCDMNHSFDYEITSLNPNNKGSCSDLNKRSNRQGNENVHRIVERWLLTIHTLNL